MKLTVFHSDKGDCLLLTSKDDKRHVLVDGGMRASFKESAAPALGKLAEAGVKLDLVYVSHIDQDHISGVLQLMDDLVAWRVFDHRDAEGIKPNKKPSSSRPPEVKEVWHNAFHELVEDNKRPIGDLLAAGEAAAVVATNTGTLAELAGVLGGADEAAENDWKRELAQEYQELAASIPEAIQLSRRIGDEQLGIPLNQKFGGKLAFVREEDPPQAISLGTLRLFVIGPFEADLKVLRKKWNEWLKANEERLEEIREKAREDAARLGVDAIASLPEVAAIQAAVLGDRKEVTAPNLASLMLLVTEGPATLLLTGDGHSSDILKGLAYHKKLDDKGRIHVNVLKVQHHGSENNMDEEFVAKVTADAYIFCGNGEHENPDLRVVKLILDSRLDAAAAFRASHPKAAGAFKLWFNSSEDATKKDSAKAHMRQLENLVKKRAQASGGRLSVEFLSASKPSFELNF